MDETGTVHVGQNDQLVVLFEIGKRIGRIRKGGPMLDGRTERRCPVVAETEAQL